MPDFRSLVKFHFRRTPTVRFLFRCCSIPFSEIPLCSLCHLHCEYVSMPRDGSLGASLLIYIRFFRLVAREGLRRNLNRSIHESDIVWKTENSSPLSGGESQDSKVRIFSFSLST